MNLSNTVIQNQMEKENHQLYKDQSRSPNLFPNISSLSSPLKLNSILDKNAAVVMSANSSKATNTNSLKGIGCEVSICGKSPSLNLSEDLSNPKSSYLSNLTFFSN